MDNKKIYKNYGFSMNLRDKNAILVKGIVKQKVQSQKKKREIEKKFSKITIHLIDEGYLEKLNEIGISINDSSGTKTSIFRDSLFKIGEFFMK